MLAAAGSVQRDTDHPRWATIVAMQDASLQESMGPIIDRTKENLRSSEVRDFPGLFERANDPFRAIGLDMPWYSAFGNHDALVQGNQWANASFEAILNDISFESTAWYEPSVSVTFTLVTGKPATGPDSIPSRTPFSTAG